jgi:hypothetical protein
MGGNGLSFLIPPFLNTNQELHGMKLTTFAQYMPSLYMTSSRKHGLAVNLKGRPGHGKTWTVERFPDIMLEAYPDKRYGIRVIEGATLTHSGALGYMVLGEKDKYGHKSVFSTPYWMYTLEGKHLSEYDGGILVIDDWHLIDADLKKIMSQGAYEGIFANHKLPPGWVIWFVGNRPQDRSGATRDYEHTTLRQLTVEISDDLDGVVQFFENNNALQETIEFIKKFAQEHIYVPAPKEIEPYCCPRTLFQSDMLLQDLKEMFGMDELPVDANVLELVSGSIGKSAANDYITYIEEANALPKHQAIIKSPLTVKMPPLERPDLWRLQAYKLAGDVQVKEADAALKYMERFPQEFQTIFVRAAAANNSPVLLQPKVREWMKKNMVLMAAISGLEEAAE